MKEITGDLWSYRDKGYIVITTNGTVKLNGECVMGRGVALQAKNKFSGIAKQLGTLIKVYGNHVYLLSTAEGAQLISFPVKHHWAEKADLPLIKRSVQELKTLAKTLDGKLAPNLPIYMPRPGCGNGGLTWIEVKPILIKYLDARFTVVNFK